MSGRLEIELAASNAAIIRSFLDWGRSRGMSLPSGRNLDHLLAEFYGVTEQDLKREEKVQAPAPLCPSCSGTLDFHETGCVSQLGIDSGA